MLVGRILATSFVLFSLMRTGLIGTTILFFHSEEGVGIAAVFARTSYFSSLVTVILSGGDLDRRF